MYTYHAAGQIRQKESNKMNKSLKARAKEMTAAQLPIMQGKEKGDTADLLGVIVTINDYDFMSGDDGHYAVFTVVEDSGKFYFAGKVLTENLSELETDGYKASVQSEGLPMVMTMKKAKKGGRTYASVIFYPEDTAE